MNDRDNAGDATAKTDATIIDDSIKAEVVNDLFINVHDCTNAGESLT